MTKTKRFLSLFLAVMIVLSVPVGASASKQKPSIAMPEVPEGYSIQYIGK